jgi:hypothetical protein
MFSRALALALIALPAAAAAAPLPSHQWWEKVTVTVPAGGDAQCVFSSSREASKTCEVEAEAGALAGAVPDKGQTTTITFERRFAPAAASADARIGAGDMLLGGQVMKLAIGADGTVAGCKVVEQAEGMETDYGCAEAAAERFAAGAEREGYLTILIYAHSEEIA